MNRIELIKRNTQEIVTEAELKELLKKKKKPVAYWGTAPTGRVHIGYLIQAIKWRDFSDAGFKFKILIADLHARLDYLKTSETLVKPRTEYYIEIVKALIDVVGAKKAELVQGSDFQLSKNFNELIIKILPKITMRRAIRAAAEVVRLGEEPVVAGGMYPILQIIDIHFLNADVAFGGIDQRGTYMLARDSFPKIGLKKPIFVFSPLLPGLTGGKMSASVQASKIDLLDSRKIVEKKINSAFCPAKQVEENGVLAILRLIIFPILRAKKFVIKRPAKFGGNISFSKYTTLEKAYASGKLHPADLKNAVAKELNNILEPIRKSFANKKALLEKAYP